MLQSKKQNKNCENCCQKNVKRERDKKTWKILQSCNRVFQGVLIWN